jgi:hypothetical protein
VHAETHAFGESFLADDARDQQEGDIEAGVRDPAEGVDGGEAWHRVVAKNGIPPGRRERLLKILPGLNAPVGRFVLCATQLSNEQRRVVIGIVDDEHSNGLRHAPHLVCLGGGSFKISQKRPRCWIACANSPKSTGLRT